MTDKGRTPDEDEQDESLPSELEHSSAGADEAREAVRSGHGADGVGEDDLDQQALHAAGDLDDDGDVDEDDREIAATRGRRSSTVEPKRGGPRFIQFLRASWAELQRVQWPDRRQVAQATAVVIGFVAVAGTWLGVSDWLANQIVKAIL